MNRSFRPQLERMEDRTLPSFYVGELVIVTDPTHFAAPHLCRVEGVSPNQQTVVVTPRPFLPQWQGWWVYEPVANVIPIRP